MIGLRKAGKQQWPVDILDNDTLAQLVDELYDEVCVYDSQYRMVYINKACQRHYGYTPEDLIGKELMTFEHEQWWDMSILPHVYQDKKPYAIRPKDIDRFKSVYHSDPYL